MSGFMTVLLATLQFATPGAGGHRASAALDVPVVLQEPERCGEAALVMVLRYYAAGDAATREAEGAYDPVLRGSLITDLAGAARRPAGTG